MGQNIDPDGIQVPPLFVTPISYKLSKEHTISAIESLVLISADFRSLMNYGEIERIDKEHLRGVIESILNDMVANRNEIVSRFEISRQVIMHYMTDINELTKLRNFDRLIEDMEGVVIEND